MTTIRTSGLVDEYAAAMGLQSLSREIELNSEDVERRLVEVRRQHPEETPEQQYARAVARELWFNYPRLRRGASPEPPQIQPAQQVQTVTLRMTTWQKFAVYLWMVVALILLGVIAARGQGPMIEALDEGVRLRFFAAGVFRWNCIGAGVTCTWNPVTQRIDLTVAGGAAAHNLLSLTHPDTVAAAPVQGDLIVGSAVPDWQRFARGGAGQMLRMNPAGTDPAWVDRPISYVQPLISPASQSPADGLTYYLGGVRTTWSAAAFYNNARVLLPTSGTLQTVVYDAWIDGVFGSGENVNLFIRLNDALDVANSVQVWNTGHVQARIAGVGQAVAAGDFVAIKVVCPNWVTNPTNVYLRAYLYIE